MQVDQLLALIQRAVEFRRLKVENERYRAHLENLVRERSAQLAASLEEIRRSHEFTLQALVAMLDARENQTAEHSIRVQALTVALAEKTGMQGHDLEVVAQGALLHDLGKISIADSILLKREALLPEEWEVMHKHPETGYRILSASSYLKEAAEIVRAHHERRDGTGYPRGLRGEEICIGARLFAVIDAYEAMRAGRLYRDAMTAEEATAEIRNGSGTQFDPGVVEAFLRHLPDMERLLSQPIPEWTARRTAR
jgi:putative nucleotidyltransferase with HDIG domain